MQIFVEILVILFRVFAKGDCSRQKAQHKKAISDQASACAEREDREWLYQQKSVAGGMVCKLSEFREVARSGRVEAVVAQRSDFVLYS